MINPVPPSAEDRNPRGPPIVLNGIVAKSIIHARLLYPRPVIRPDSHSIIPVIADTAILDNRMGSTLTEVDSIRIVISDPAPGNHQPLRDRHPRIVTSYPESTFKMLHP